MKVYRCIFSEDDKCHLCLNTISGFKDVTGEFDTSNEAILKIMDLLGSPDPGTCYLVVTEPKFVGKIPEREELPVAPKEEP